MRIGEFASCFVGARIGYDVCQEVYSVGFLSNGQSYEAPGYDVVYYNFTRHDVYIVYGDGRRLKVKPTNRALASGHLIHRQFMDRYDGQFVIVKTPNRHYNLDKTKLLIKTKDGRELNAHGAELDAVKRKYDENGDVLSIIKSIGERQLNDNYTGIPIPDMFMTIGFEKADYVVYNKIAAIFPNKGRTSPTAGIRIHATVSSSYMNKFYVVIGTSTYEIKPKLCDKATNLVHIYKTETDGTEILINSIPIDDLFENIRTDVYGFRSEEEAKQYIRKTLEIHEKFEDVSKANKKLKEELDKVKYDNEQLKRERDQAKADTKAEKTKNTNSKWTKFSAIFAAVCTIVGAAITLAIKLL